MAAFRDFRTALESGFRQTLSSPSVYLRTIENLGGPTMDMLHHVSLGVADIERATRMYDEMLAPLGYVRVWSDLRPGEADQAVGYGLPNGGDKLSLKLRPKSVGVGEGFHLAFTSPDSRAVDAFYAAAMRNGGVDNGAPGYRPNYGPNYYAAFIVDVDGHHLEAVSNSLERG